MADTVGMQDIRGENISKVITVLANAEYVFKQLVNVETSNKWKETYYKEAAADLTGGTGSAIEGVPRNAAFPSVEVGWTLASSYHLKHGAQTNISWEDVITDEIDVMQRSMIKVARAISKSVDINIWNTLTENQTPSTINTLPLTVGYEWDSTTIANRDPIQDILNAKKLLYEDNYNPDRNGFLVLNPKDYANILGNANVRNAGQFYTDDVTRNGKVGFILGLKVLVSNNVTADKAAVIIGGECGTWKSAAPLTSVVIEDKGLGYTLRSWEVGCCQLKNPQAVCLITNTAA